MFSHFSERPLRSFCRFSAAGFDADAERTFGEEYARAASAIGSKRAAGGGSDMSFISKKSS